MIRRLPRLLAALLLVAALPVLSSCYVPEQIVNIAKNVADKPIDIDPAEYQDMVKEELIKSGMLNESNFIDEQKKAEASSEDEISVNNEEKKALDVIT